LGAALAVLVAAGCTGTRIIPVFRPIRTEHVKPGGRYTALVVLPKKGLASVHLHFRYRSGRVALSDIAIVNHYPDRVTTFATKTQVYVDDGKPLEIGEYRELNRRKRREDFDLLKDLPDSAKGTWLYPRPRLITKDTVRGPTLVLFYSVDGHDGFVKVHYRALWDIPGS